MSIRTTVLLLKARELAWGNSSVDYKNYNCPNLGPPFVFIYFCGWK
jgi:hypothetical protein